MSDYYDLGSYARAVTTSPASAQAWFDRGLIWAYSFNHEEAVRCFGRAPDHDPHCALAYWGLAYALGPHYNKPWESFDPVDLSSSVSRAFAASAAAARAVSGGSAAERGLVRAQERETPVKQYMLAVHSVEGEPVPSPEATQQTYRDVEAVNAQLRDAGAWVFGGGLHPASTATVVRVRDGEVLTTDGPFAETKEQLGGFWVIQAADLDAALEWSAKAAAACRAPVEVRPFQEEPEG